jgi:hypothetical protein
LLCIIVESKAQSKNSFDISVPIIFNYSKAPQPFLSSRVEIDGSAISYGLNLNYTRIVGSSFFIKGGIGLFKQIFGVNRPVDFMTANALLRYTKTYSYNCVQYLIGVGYYKNLSKNAKSTFGISFNSFQSFSQSYNSDLQVKNKNSITLGYRLDISAGIEKKMSNNLSIGAHFILPVICHWKTDNTFLDDSKIARNIISIGISPIIKYHF